MITQTNATKTCSECIHWNMLDTNKGECRRQPPQQIAVKLNDETQYETHFPVSKSSDWCGEFAR